MEELNKQDLAWIFQVAVLNIEGEDLSQMINKVPIKCIKLGKEVLEFIKEKW